MISKHPKLLRVLIALPVLYWCSRLVLETKSSQDLLFIVLVFVWLTGTSYLDLRLEENAK